MKLFRDKVAIVTGGASGIGKALCEALGTCGAQVTVADINGHGAQQVAEHIAHGRGRASAATLDVTVEAQVRALIETTNAEKGRLDYIFNNAGIGIGGQVHDMTIDHWQRIVAVNLWGVIHGTLAAYRIMVTQGFGHIVNTSSSAGLVPSPLLTAYGMTKHAVLGLSTGLRAEAADLGVKVSVVCPGFIDTPIFDTTTYVKTGKDVAWAIIPSWIKMMSAEACAQAILRGVSRNKGIIPVQAPAYVMWWLNRLSPKIMDIQLRQGVARYRKALLQHKR
jgi:NAD(P)-dependent dehydrogenase (short-subunit alcohol dehydrogenase family)